MLPITVDAVRLFVHVLAATIWVGGQFTLAGLVSTLKEIDSAAPKAVARRFNQLAWPAFGVLVVTGFWSVGAVRVEDTSTAYQVTLLMKLGVVALSGISAFLHTRAATKQGLAIWGAVTSLSALAALFLGILL